jgi:hypothetical protein
MVRVRSVLIAASLGIVLAGPASADVLLMENIQSAPEVQTPRKGMNMDSVRNSYGNPIKEHPAVSTTGNPSHPPITRWDYQGFSVFFENDLVLHSVVHRPDSN